MFRACSCVGPHDKVPTDRFCFLAPVSDAKFGRLEDLRLLVAMDRAFVCVCARNWDDGDCSAVGVSMSGGANESVLAQGC